jgi:hypothetical protein
MKRWCGWLVGAFAIGIAGVATSQEIEPFRTEPPQTPDAPRPPVKPQPHPTQSVPQRPVGPESEPTAAVTASASGVSAPPSFSATATPSATPTQAAAPTPARPNERSSTSGSALRTAGIITGGAILGVGVVTGILAITKRSSWHGQCNEDNKVCEQEAKGDYDAGILLANVSTGTVIGGAAILAASIFLLPHGSTRTDDGSRKAGRRSVWVSAGPHGGQLMGRVEF